MVKSETCQDPCFKNPRPMLQVLYIKYIQGENLRQQKRTKTRFQHSL